MWYIQQKTTLLCQLSFKEILDETEISKDDYYRVLSISKDKEFELHLKRQHNFCFVNNYFDDTQPVFNEYKAATYICQYFWKILILKF